MYMSPLSLIKVQNNFDSPRESLGQHLLWVGEVLKGGKGTAISPGFAAQESRWRKATVIEHLLLQGLRHRAVLCGQHCIPRAQCWDSNPRTEGCSPMRWEVPLTTVPPIISVSHLPVLVSGVLILAP